MSQGTRVYTVRLSDEMMAEVQDCMQRRDFHSANSPWTLSDFIKAAITEKLSHMARSRKSCRKGKVTDGPGRTANGDSATGEKGGEAILSTGEGRG
jgi:Arc/MetJ-type ribon-helix-helix transcriptional regulator